MAFGKSKKEASEENLPVVQGTTAVSNRPAYLKSGDSRGMETITREDIVIPRLAVCQSNSPQKKRDNPKSIKGIEEGDLFNTLTGKVYGRAVRFTPILIYKSRLFFGPREEGSKILCSSPNAVNGGIITPQGCNVCPHSQFSGSSRPACSLLYNYLGVLHNESHDMLILSMKSTQIKVAKGFNGLVRFRSAPVFAGVYEIATVADKNAKGDYYSYKVDNAPEGEEWVPDGMFPVLERLHNEYRETAFQMDVSDLEEGPAPGREPGMDFDDNGEEVPY